MEGVMNMELQKNDKLRITAYIAIAVILGIIHTNLLFAAILVESIVHILYVRKMSLEPKKRMVSYAIASCCLLFSAIVLVGEIKPLPAIETLAVQEDAKTFDINQEEILSWAYTPEDADTSNLFAQVSDDTLAKVEFSEDGALIVNTLSKEGSFDVTLHDGNVVSNAVTFTIVDEKKEAERIAAEKAEQERIAAEKAEQERIAAEKAEQERIATEKAEQERIAAEKAEQERVAAEQQEVNSPTVYVTPTGKRYHYSSSCNGGSYSPTTLEQALARNLTPCQKCT